MQYEYALNTKGLKAGGVYAINSEYVLNNQIHVYGYTVSFSSYNVLDDQQERRGRKKERRCANKNLHVRCSQCC